jgi:hypothetical protein
MREPASVEFCGRSAEEAVLLSGPPQRVAGRVHLRNLNAATSVTLRHAGLTDKSGRLGHLPARHRLSTIALRPAEDRTVEIAIELDHATLAGAYHVELDVAGHVRPAVLNVVESVGLRLEPKRIVVLDARPPSHPARLLVSNEGNVELRIRDIGPVDLYDDVAEVRMREALTPLFAQIGDRPKDLAAVLLALVPLRGPALGRLNVRVPDSPIHLAPGDTRMIEIVIEIPPELPNCGRLRGRAAVLTANLDFLVIQPPGTAAEPATETANAKRRGGNPAERSK